MILSVAHSEACTSLCMRDEVFGTYVDVEFLFVLTLVYCPEYGRTVMRDATYVCLISSESEQNIILFCCVVIAQAQSLLWGRAIRTLQISVGWAPKGKRAKIFSWDVSFSVASWPAADCVVDYRKLYCVVTQDCEAFDATIWSTGSISFASLILTHTASK